MTYDNTNTGEGADVAEMLHQPSFVPLAKINCSAATESSIQFEYIKYAITLGLPRIHNLPEWGIVKGQNTPWVLVGGGPSLKTPEVFEELYQMYDNGDTIIACGSSYDWLIEQSIIPDYCVVCDPDPITLNYITHKGKGVKFLVATCCHPSIYEHLKGEDVILWHCHGGDNTAKIHELEPNENGGGLSGGCTVGLRSINIGIMFGYTNIHMFGFDSCLANDGAHHTYEFSDETKEEVGAVYKIKLGYIRDGAPKEKEYLCCGYHIAQAEQFKNFYAENYMYFTPTFHGDGMLPDYFDIIINETKYLEANPRPVEDWRMN